MPGINWDQVNKQKPAAKTSAPVSSSPQNSNQNQKPEDFLGNVFSKARDVFKSFASPVGLNVPPMVGDVAKSVAKDPKAAIEGAADQLPLIGAVVPTALIDFFTEGLAIPADVAIAGGGAAVGKFLDEAVHGIFDKHQSVINSAKGVVTDPNKLLAIGATGVLGSVGEGAAQTILPFMLSKALSTFSGIAEPLIKAAYSGSESVAEGFKGGFSALDDLVRTVSPKLEQAMVEGKQYYGQQLEAIKDIPAKGGQEALGGLMTKVQKVLKTGKVAVEDGLLNFERVPHFSSGDMTAIGKAFKIIKDTVSNIGETTAENLDSSIQAMGGLRNFEGNVGGDAKSILGQMYHELNSFIQDFHPHLAEIRNESIPAMEFFSRMGEIIPKPGQLDNAAVKSASSKLMDVFNPANARGSLQTIEGGAKIMVQDVLKELPGLEKYIGKDILPTIQGAAIKSAEDTSAIGSVSRMRIIGKLFRGVSSEIIKAPLKIAGISTTMESIVSTLFDRGVPQSALRGIAQYLIQKFAPDQAPKTSTSSKSSLPNTPPLKVNEGSKPTSRKSGGRMIAKDSPIMDRKVLASDISTQKTPPGKTVIGTSDQDGQMQYIAADVDKTGQIVKAGLNLG